MLCNDTDDTIFISILGSTGSIGTQTLEIIRANPCFRVTALAGGKNIELLEQQIREFRPALAAVEEKEDAQLLMSRLKDLPVRVLWGMDGMMEIACEPRSGMLVTAIVGMIGIRPTLAAIRSGKDIALANKETLVTAGHLIIPLAKQCGVKIYPVDSEHSAILQSMRGEEHASIDKVLLTTSGGPFRGMTREQLETVTPAAALKHPNWSMGNKITIDSATLVNKGLEVMEASWLFNVPLENIEVIIQPQSILHSMVQYNDGAVIAQLGTPNMKIPIQYALFRGKRLPLAGERLDFKTLGAITFEKPDTETFEGLPLALEAAKAGGTMPTVFNAANEEAVDLFLNGKIRFLQIYDIIRKCMQHHQVLADPGLDTILAAEEDTRRYARSI